MSSPRWLADEMVGRLARYLRFVGCDTRYVRGLSDDEVLELARVEDRVILTRDRRLAGRAERALLLESPDIAGQWRAVHDAYPGVPTDIRFDRCTECNGNLEKVVEPPPEPRIEGVPWDRVAQGLPLFRCAACGHFYWEGTHTADIRARLASWTGSPAP
ncbi:MAG: Mut7-C RNAse domain-containing protein [Thermoplasmata archaeon]